MSNRPAERVVCNLCGSSNFHSLFTLDSRPFYNSNKSLRDKYTIARCGDCGLVFVKEIPSEAELKDVYGEGYYTGRDFVGYQNYGPTSSFDRVAHWVATLPSRILRLLKRPSAIPGKVVDVFARPKLRPWPYDLVDLVEKYSNKGNILDVGCATGLFLLAARESGWDTRGVEFSDYSSQRARDDYKLDVVTGTLHDARRVGELKENSYDVVTLWDTAEHVQDPMAIFSDAWKILRPGGLLFVKTLNIDSDRSKAEGNDWHFFRPPKHLFYYSEKTLKAYFERAGFDLVGDDNFANDVVTVVGRK